MKPGWALLLFCAAFLDVRAGDAEPSSLTAVLTLRKPDASPECFDQSGIQAAVEARLGRAVFVGESSADVRLELTFSVQPGGGWRAELMLSSRGGRFLGSRELSTRAEHCSALDDSLALVVALLLDIPR
ncbi:MAG TPA: hypothetical protein VGJ84_01550, partial [Polyangiaceae bacterium]